MIFYSHLLFTVSDMIFHFLFISKLYHPNNAQLGMATMRAGVTHWHAGLIEVAHKLICKAYAILLITHGSQHPITKDLEVSYYTKEGLFISAYITCHAITVECVSFQSMRTQTESELRLFKENEHIYHSMREAALSQKAQVYRRK